MLKIEDKQILYGLDFIKDQIETIEDVVNVYSGYDVSFFYNIISSPDCRYEHGRKERINEKFREMKAKDRFLNILKEKKIIGHPKGYFVNKCKDPLKFDEIKSVSFAFTSYNEMSDFFKARDSEYGICFYHDSLLNKGLREVIYINDKPKEYQELLFFNSPHLVEIIGEKYDMSWENEWRIKGDFEFKPSDIAFLIVPDSDFNDIINQFEKDKNLNNYINQIIPSSNYISPRKTIKNIDKVLSIWEDIQVNDSKQGSIQVKFDRFPEITNDDQLKLNKVFRKYYKPFGKSLILMLYENKFFNNYLKFIENIKPIHRGNFTNKQTLIEKESQHCIVHIDLVKYFFENLYKIQKGRIVNKKRKRPIKKT